MNLVKDIPVTLSIELGRTRMSLKDLLELEQGAVIELERMVDEPMDVLVNGTLVAHGEVVVIDDTLGVRLTDVAAPDA
jgi:flagellar motor switch protein FliN/FliY